MMLTVDPGESQMIQVTFTPPSGSSPDPSSFPIFSGFIKIASAPLNESLTVAYLGLAAKLSSLMVLDTGTGVTKGYPLPAIIVGSTGKVQRLPRPYTFANGDIPVMQFRLVGGSRQVIVEVVEAATQTVIDVLPVGDSGSSSGLGAAGVARRAAELGMLSSTAGESGAGVFGLEIDALGRQNTALDFEAEYAPMQVRQVLAPPSLRPAGSVGQVAASSLLPRNTLDPDYGIYAVAWDGTVTGVGKVRPGDYQLHLKALKLGADPSQASSSSGSASGRNSSASPPPAPSTQTGSDASSPWEEWFSPIIRVE